MIDHPGYNSTLGLNQSECDFNTLGNTSSMGSSQLPAIFVIPELIFMLLVTVGNILVLAAVWKFPELQTCTNIFVVNLGITDLTVGIFALPLHVIIFIFPVIKSVFVVCMLRYCVIMATTAASALTLILISIDRYIAIEKPYSYPTIITKRRSKLLCAGVWFGSLAFASLPFMGWNTWTPCKECTFTVVFPEPYLILISSAPIVCSIIIGILNIRIFRTANAISRDISRQAASVSDQPQNRKYRQLFIQNKKAAKVLFLVFGLFSICVLPFSFVIIWETIALDDDTRKRYHVLRLVVSSIPLINSAMNPVIYHNRMPEFRKAFRKMLRLNRVTEQTSGPHANS